MDWIRPIVDIFKLSLPIWIALACASGFALFAPDAWLTRIGIKEMVHAHRSYVGAGFVVVAFLAVVQSATKLVKWFVTRVAHAKLARQAKCRLQRLTAEEKQILCGYLLPGRRTQYFGIQDGVVQGLCHARLIYRSSAAGDMHGDGFAFNIVDWVYEYLERNERLILEGVPRDGNGHVMLYDNPFNIFNRRGF